MHVHVPIVTAPGPGVGPERVGVGRDAGVEADIMKRGGPGLRGMRRSGVRSYLTMGRLVRLEDLCDGLTLSCLIW